ncbi:MAG: LETM1 domain-containing protein [Myxococcales bacterium]
MELPVGSTEWLLAVVGAVAARPQITVTRRLDAAQGRDRLETLLRTSGLSYGTGAVDPAVELAANARPGERAFAHFVAGIVRLCTEAAALSYAPGFAPEDLRKTGSVAARRNQLLAVLASVAGHARAARPLFMDPAAAPDVLTTRIAGRVAARLSRRYLALGGPFAGLPLHNGLCAIEARACGTLALVSFAHRRLSLAAARLIENGALRWRVILVEALAGLSAAQLSSSAQEPPPSPPNAAAGTPAPAMWRGMDQVLRAQRLPARENRLLRRALESVPSPEAVAHGIGSPSLRRFAIEHVLLAALVDRHFDKGEMNFVGRLAAALGMDPQEVSLLQIQADEFYRKNGDAFVALQHAEIPEGLPHAFTTRLSALVLDNLDRILQEIRETGELAQLLAKASAGNTLTSEEKGKVREQLIDLAKAIPALAVFAAPGGMLLLPVLLKLLPFNLLPSSFIDPPARPPLRLPPAGTSES